MMLFRCTLTIMWWFVCFATVFTQTLEVAVSNLRSDKGQLCVALFDSEKGFKKEQPCWEKNYSKEQLQEDEGELIICVPPGIYGLSVLDDENSDGKMNYNWIGVPQEGFGFSFYEHKGVRKPQFKQFVFKADEDDKIKIEVFLRYF